MNGVSLTPATFMSPAYYAIHTAVNPLLTNGFSIAVEAANAPNAEYTWHGAASSSGNQATVSVLTAGHPKTVTLTVQVSGVSSTYTLHFYKPLAYYYQEGASAGGTGETSDSPFHLLSDALNRAKTTGINKVEILGELTAASSLGNAATLFCFNAGYGTADHPFIIRNFYFDGQGTTGGKRIVSVESTSTNNYIVFENPYMAGAATNSSGGGMYITTANSYHAQVTLKATSWSGGGIAIEGLNAKLFIQDETGTSQTLISNNTAVSGGGIHIASSAVVEIYSGKISLNTATNGGGINAEGTCKLNGYVTDNTAESGGGFYIKGGTCTLNGAYVTGNTATSGNGGGFYLEDGILISGTLNLLPNPLLDLLCQISSNTAPNGIGGGIYLTGSTGYTVTFSVNTTISDNSAGNTGGIYLTTSDSPSDSPTSTVTFNAPVLFQNNTNDTDTEVQIWKEGSQGISIFNVSNIVYPSGYSIGESVIAESRSGLRSLPGNEFVLSYSSSPPS